MRGETGQRALAHLARLSLSGLSARVTPRALPVLFAQGRALGCTAIGPSTSFTQTKTRSNNRTLTLTRGLAASAEGTDGSAKAPIGSATESNTSVPSPLQRAPAPKNTTQASFAGTLTDASKTKVHAHRREAKGSPKKFNDVCRLVRGLRVEDAVAQCALSPKRYADVVRKVILSAAANASNNHDLDREKLMIVEALVGKGTFIKRVSVHGRGRAGVITKPRSHITIGVAEIGSIGAKNSPIALPLRKMTVVEHEAPWKRRRRSAMKKYAMAKEAGMV